MNIAITYSQAQHLVDQWNDLANSRHQLEYSQAHLVMSGDCFDDELIEDGVTTVEVGSFESATGNPQTFNVWADDVCIIEEEVTA